MRQKAVMFARTAIRIIPPASHQILPVKPVIIAVTASNHNALRTLHEPHLALYIQTLSTGSGHNQPSRNQSSLQR